MKDLIEALQIFLKYSDKEYPIQCEHDIMHVHIVEEKKEIAKEDRKKLKELGFLWSNEHECFISFKYGNC